MQIRNLFTPLLSLVFCTYALSALAQSQKWPEVSDDGLRLVKGSKMSVVYAEPGADLGIYKRVMLKTPEVAFKKNWERQQRAGSADKLGGPSTRTIKRKLAEEFEAVFTETLTNGGYELVEEAASDVLVVRPMIINLDVNAPNRSGAGRNENYVRSAGEMTLYIELFDSETGDMIAKALDRKVDNPNNVHYYTWATPASNKQAADTILTGWANILLNALNEAKDSAPLPMPEAD